MSEFQLMIAELADKVAAKAAIKTAERVLAERPILQRYLSPKEACLYLGVSIDALQLWRGQERGPSYIRMNRLIRYDRRTVDEWMAGRTPGLDGAFVGRHMKDETHCRREVIR